MEPCAWATCHMWVCFMVVMPLGQTIGQTKYFLSLYDAVIEDHENAVGVGLAFVKIRLIDIGPKDQSILRLIEEMVKDKKKLRRWNGNKVMTKRRVIQTMLKPEFQREHRIWRHVEVFPGVVRLTNVILWDGPVLNRLHLPRSTQCLTGGKPANGNKEEFI